MRVATGAAVLSLLVVAGYSLAYRSPPAVPAAKPRQNVEPDAKLTGDSDDPKAYWKIPAGASDADRAIMLDWYSKNEICRGSNVTADSPECVTRDATGQKLGARGWCWAYDDINIAPADYQWHRCMDEQSDKQHKFSEAAQIDEDDPGDASAQNVGTASDDAADTMLGRYEDAIVADILAEARYEADQQCIGLPGYEGRDGLQNRMIMVNARYFPKEHGLWIEAGSWAQKLLDAKIEENKKIMCVTLDGSPPTSVLNHKPKGALESAH